MVSWTLAYLLVGFGLDFVGTKVSRSTSSTEWYWDLVAIALWPVVLAFAPFVAIRQRRGAQ